MATSRTGIQSEKSFRLAGRWASRLCHDNRPAISGLNPTAHEKHGHEQRSAIALKLLFGYLNCRPSNIVVKYSTEGGGGRFSTRYQGGGDNCGKDPNYRGLSFGTRQSN